MLRYEEGWVVNKMFHKIKCERWVENANFAWRTLWSLEGINEVICKEVVKNINENPPTMSFENCHEHLPRDIPRIRRRMCLQTSSEDRQ